jgi:hypothetical protein
MKKALAGKILLSGNIPGKKAGFYHANLLFPCPEKQLSSIQWIPIK